jgi:cytochrome c
MRITLLAISGVLCLAACGNEPEETALAPDIAAEAAAPAAAPKLTLADLPEPYNAADLANGKVQFEKCKACHSLKPEDPAMVGPNLHGVFTRGAGTLPKFRYSEALKNVTIEKWTPEELDQWLTDPKAYLPGSAMFFNGIDDPDARRDVIAYIATES